jgi:beta-glucosidase
MSDSQIFFKRGAFPIINHHYQLLAMHLRLFPLLLLALMSACSSPQESEPSKPVPMTNAETEARIDSLLAEMTLAEKVGQMNQYNGSWDVTGPAKGNDSIKREHIAQGLVGSMLNVVSIEATREAQQIAVEQTRLGIPLLFAYDVIHGYETMFPVPLGESASWDLAAIETSARFAALEASAAGLHWTFAPMVDISRDARWGRVMEGAGEDPYLGSRIAEARVRGFQGNDLSQPHTVAACAKHFAAYGYSIGGRDYNAVDISEATLQNVVLPPFKAAADAGVATFMNAFNTIGGIPSSGNAHLQRDILKGDWDWPGFVISDWASIQEMVVHGYAEDNRHAARLAVLAGSDMDMEGYCYVPHLIQLVEDGVVEEAVVDDAVRRILRVKFALGLFDDPYRYCDPEREKNDIGSAAAHEASREVARKSIVLLKNEESVLPLEKGGRIAVIGPLADDQDVPLGSWRARAIRGSAVSVLAGIKAAVGDGAEVTYAQGVALSVGERSFSQEVTINETDSSGFAEAREVAAEADVVVMVLGEDCFQSGEARSRTRIDLPGLQPELLQEIRKVNDNIVLVLMNGRPLDLSDVAPQVKGLLETWFLGSQTGHAIADVMFGDHPPVGKLPISFPRALGQVPLYYAETNTGRPTHPEGLVFYSHYIDEENSALYPFGYGLSYTSFAYSDLRMSDEEIGPNETLEVSVQVKNTGRRTGEEVVQLYVRDLVGSRTRPVQELKRFAKIKLSAGESERVTFRLRAEDLAFYTGAGRWEAEPGSFRVMVGGDAYAARTLSGGFELTE